VSEQAEDALDVDALRERVRDADGVIASLRRELAEIHAREARARAELVRSAQLASLGNLVRGVAHELNTPLGALASNHDVTRRALDRLQVILEDEQVTEEELGQVRKIVHAITGVQDTSAMAVERMKHVVGSLRTFGRPDRSQVDRVDVGEALHGTLALLKHELGESITVDEELPALPPVECYPQQLNQVFMNLLMNAIQAMPRGGRLTLRGRAAPDRLVIEIGDTGMGIAEENLERIFEPGFTTKGARVGMGLGLLICSEIMDRHGGEISVNSKVGVGTTFTLGIPLSLPAGATEGRAARAESPGG
jgi:signal transduction histidine kinase